MFFSHFMQEYPLDPKLLIVPFHSFGLNMIWEEAKHSKGCTNLRVVTLSQLAEEVLTEEVIRQNKQVIDVRKGERIIETLLHEQKDSLTFFKSEQFTIPFIKKLYTTLLELKNHNVTPLPESSPKLQAISMVFQHYQDYLRFNGLWDQSDLFHEAIKHPSKLSNTIFGVLSNVECSPREREFLLYITGDSYHPIDVPDPRGDVHRPKSYLIQGKNNSYHHPILNLYSSEKMNQTDRIDLFKAYGETNEVHYVFQQILNEGIPFDEVLILYTDSIYVSHIQEAAGFYEIPLTLGSGESIKPSRTFQFLNDICTYMVNGYQISDLKGIISEGTITFDELQPDDLKVRPTYDDLASLKIGWGLDRTIEKLTKAILNDDKNEYLDNRKAKFEVLRAFFEDLREKTKKFQDEQSFSQFIEVITSFLKKYVRISENKGEIIAKEIILSELQNGAVSSVNVTTLEECARRALFLVEDITIHQSSEEPGKIHADRFERGGYIIRKHVFVLGLDSKRFPIQQTENPFLTDEERMNVRSTLPLAREYEAYSKYKLLETLGTVKGKITLGYSYFDTNKVRENNPSTFLYQLLDFLEMDGQDIKEYGFVTKNLEFASSRLLHHLSNDIHKDGMLRLVEKPELNISNAGHVTNFTEEHILSASALERALACNRKFYFHDILKLREKEEPKFDTGSWLHANEKGSLYHKIYERYVQEVLIDHGTISMKEIINEELVRMKQEIPPSTEALFRRESEKANHAGQQFAEEIQTSMTKNKWKPVQTEWKFEDIKINIETEHESRTLRLRGSIDRVDCLENNTYRIVDYKTGNYRSFNKQKSHLQNYLYKLAYEAANMGHVVEETEYYFPFDQKSILHKKEAIVERKVSKETIKVSEILVELIDSINSGTTYPAEHKDHCKYCEYIGICRSTEDEE